MMFRRVVALYLLLFTPLVLADAMDVSLNNNAIAFNYDISGAALIQGNSDFNIGVLYNDSMNTLVNAGLLVKGDGGDSSDATLAVGAKVLAGEIQNYRPGSVQNVSSIVIGGELSYAFPAVKQLSAALYLFVGPSIATFGDANRANQWGAHVDYEVSQGTKVYVEYRNASFGMSSTGQTAVLDSGTYMGVKLSF